MREMKESGIEWIGKMPESWGIIRFKYLHNGLNTGEAIDKEYWSDDENNRVFYTAGLVPIRTDYTGFPLWKYTTADDLLLARNGTPYVYFPEVGACYTDHIIRASVKAGICKKYVKYCLQCSISSVIVETVSIPTWSASLWNKQELAWPSYEEQITIADFLDKKCAQVDTLIANVQAQIEKLKAYKQSVITEVITKGLDPTVPMKDSGVEWIGEIPTHWEITRKLAFVTTEGISYGIVKLFDPDDVNGVKVLRCSDVLEGWIKPDNIRTVTQKVSNEYARTILSGGEVVVNVRGSLGGCAVVPEEMAGYNIAREVAKITLSNRMCNRYVMYYLLSRCFVEYRTSHLSGSVYVGLNIELLSSCPLPNPELTEQKAIADYLDEKCFQIDRLIALKQSKIEKLEQYKKSLIYEYVTGKKEVS